MGGATDTKLNRDVALKFLPEKFASDSHRMGYSKLCTIFVHLLRRKNRCRFAPLTEDLQEKG